MDEQRFAQLFREHKDSVYAFAYRMTNSPDAADDLTQDCFLALYRASGKFNPERGSIRTYLLGIVHKLAIKRWRRENRFRALEDGVPLPCIEIQIDAALSVAEAIQALSVLQREVLILCEYEGLTLEETAVVTNSDVGAVKSRLHRARTNLRQMLAPLHSARRGC